MKSSNPLQRQSNSATDPEVWITANETRQLCGGVSAMTLHRWLADPDLAFPRPAIVQSKRYFKRREVLHWMAERVKGAA